MQAVRNGDVGKLGAAIRPAPSRVISIIFFILRRTSAASEDLVQEVFFRILKYRHTYQTGHGRPPLDVPDRAQRAGRSGGAK